MIIVATVNWQTQDRRLPGGRGIRSLAAPENDAGSRPLPRHLIRRVVISVRRHDHCGRKPISLILASTPRKRKASPFRGRVLGFVNSGLRCLSTLRLILITRESLAVGVHQRVLLPPVSQMQLIKLDIMTGTTNDTAQPWHSEGVKDHLDNRV